MRKHLARSCLVAAVPMMLVACGSDTKTPPGEMPGSIVAVASANPDFSTLVSAIQAAELVDALSGAGPFTVFAPTNAAFAKLPPAALSALLADKPALQKLLKYHVVSGKVLAADVVKLTEATTLDGMKVSIRVENGSVFINDSKVTMTDIRTSNGIIHVLDTVLSPPAAPPGNIIAVASANPDFSTLVSAIQAAELVDALSGAGPFTVFAPTNAAFAKIPSAALNALLADKPALQKLLKYHVVSGKVLAADVVQLTEATTLEGTKVTIRVENGSVFINDSQVTMTDIQTSNGVIHVIDTVLTLPAAPPGNIIAVASGNPDFSTLVTAIQAAGLVDTLSGAGPFTVFAPTNAAFAALPAGTLNSLLANIPELTKILTYHVVAGRLDAAAVIAAPKAASVQGAELNFRVENGVAYVNQARITMTNIVASNGIIHVIDAVVTPPTIVDLAVAAPDLSTLVTAINAAQLAETLSGPGPFTVFAPVNSAFAALPSATLNTLLANPSQLSPILTYHVIPQRLLAAEVLAASSFATVNGQTLTVSNANSTPRINGARIIATDIVAGNGVVHLIDGVLLPQ